MAMLFNLFKMLSLGGVLKIVEQGRCLRYAIMYVGRQLWSTDRRIKGTVYPYGQDCPLSHSLSQPLTHGAHSSAFHQPPAMAMEVADARAEGDGARPGWSEPAAA